MKRAYSLLTIKSADGDARVITGIATTPTPDSYGDIVEPKGAEFDLPIPLLWQHDHRQPIGHVTHAKVSDKGIEITAKLVQITEPGVLKDRLDAAWQSIKSGLVKGLSIGFSAIESARIEGTYGYRFTKWAWRELSAVTIAANDDASIQSIKSIDRQLRAASGTKRSAVVRLDATPAGASAHRKSSAEKGRETMNIQEQIAAYEAKRAAAQAQLDGLMEKSAEAGETLDAEQEEQFEEASSDIESIDKHLKRLRQYERSMVSRATAVDTKAVNGEKPNVDKHSIEVRGNTIVSVQRRLAPGTAFTRYAMMLAASNGNLLQAVEMAKRYQDSTPELVTIMKAAVAAGTTTDATWAAPLAEYTNMASEFIELLRPWTIVGQIDGFRRVPFNIRMPLQTAGATAGWVGEGAPKPVSKLAFDTTSLGMSKIAVIVALTEELVRTSNPSAEATCRQDLIDTISQFMDEQFINPAITAVTNVSPASVTNGAQSFVTSGTTVDQITADVAKMLTFFATNRVRMRAPVWVMNPRTAIALSMKRNTDGSFAFPGISATGGTFFGYKVVTSQSVGITGSPGTTYMTLMDASEILMADDGGVTLDVSREASLQMNDAPSAGAQQMVSLWQNNLIGLRAERYINYRRRRPQAVVTLTGLTY